MGSHDRLTRLLQAEWSGQTLLELALRTLFVWQRGYLIIDDTVIPKPFARVTIAYGIPERVTSATAREALQGFRSSLLEQINVVDNSGLSHVPLYLTEWNRESPIGSIRQTTRPAPHRFNPGSGAP